MPHKHGPKVAGGCGQLPIGAHSKEGSSDRAPGLETLDPQWARRLPPSRSAARSSGRKSGNGFARPTNGLRRERAPFPGPFQ